MRKITQILFAAILLTNFPLIAQKIQVPKSYSNMGIDKQGVYLEVNGQKVYESLGAKNYTIDNFKSIKGTPKGLSLDFNSPGLHGTLYYGFIPTDDSKFPAPVFFGTAMPISGGVTQIPLSSMGGKYDMINWMTEFKGTVGYRVIGNNQSIIYDGKISFDAQQYIQTYNTYTEGAYGKKSEVITLPFQVVPSVVEGPLLANLTDQSVTIFLKTNVKTSPMIQVGKAKFRSKNKLVHEITIDELAPDSLYTYSLTFGKITETYTFRTAPANGSRTPFTFSYASDSRSGNGGGERNLGGTNAYIMKRIMALNDQKGARFMQFSGDMITGYVQDPEALRFEYINWKQAISPYARYMPVITSMGNHESLIKVFKDEVASYHIDNFPFNTSSSEAIYQQEFVNPLNGPDSEDGSIYDPDTETTDFPSYKESVFHYTYDNVAMVVLNSNYWFSPTWEQVKITSGNIHGYVMDNQMAWLKETLDNYENDADIDHVFVTLHTPFFPNGGHVEDDMWYNGNNEPRAVVAGTPVAKGIIERRDELLDIIINQTTKTRAILTGDEHNYARTQLSAQTNIYGNLKGQKLVLNRQIWQINNGAAGAPYYAQEKTPWSSSVQGFSTQNALVFIHVNGNQVNVEVLNPVTLEKFDEFSLN